MLGNVERDVELMAVVSPRDEHKLAFLLVEREVADVERAVGVGDGREHPQHLSLKRHDRVRAHTVAETVVDAAFTPSRRDQRETTMGTERVQARTRRHFAFALRCRSNATRAPTANPIDSAQLAGIPYHSSKLHPGPCNSVGMRPRTDRQTDTHTDARDHNTFRVVYDSREM